MNKSITVAVGALLLSLPIACKSQKAAEKPAEPRVARPTTSLTYEDSVQADVSAKVKALNQTSRVITLQDDKGNEETFVVSSSVQRLDEVMVGDTVHASYKAKLTAELRPPTPDEVAHPLVVTTVGGRTPEGAVPAAGSARGIRMVATVMAVDVPNMTVTLRGPMGDMAVVRGRDKQNLSHVHVTDTIVINMTDVSVVMLSKAPR